MINFIELRGSEIYNKALKFFRIQRTFDLVVGTKYYYLSRDINTALGVKFFNQDSQGFPIQVLDYDNILDRDSDESQTGTPVKAAFVELSSVQRQPGESNSDTGILKVKSSNSGDTTQKVTITGRATISGQEAEVTEEITLTGTTAVSSTYTYVYIYSISKSADTAGYVLVTDDTEAFVYSIIDQYRDKSEYQKWRFWPTADSTDTIKVTGWRRQIIPQNDSASIDAPYDLLLPFIQGLRADVHDVNFDMVKAQKFEAKFEQGLQEAIENDTWSDGEEMSLADKQYRYNPMSDLEDVAEDADE